MAATISAAARKAIDIRLIDARVALTMSERVETPATNPCLFAFVRASKNPDARILALSTLLDRAGHTLQKQDKELWNNIQLTLENYFEKSQIPEHVLNRFRYDAPSNGLRVWAHGVLHKRAQEVAAAMKPVVKQQKVASSDVPTQPPAGEKKVSKLKTPERRFVKLGDLQELRT